MGNYFVLSKINLLLVCSVFVKFRRLFGRLCKGAFSAAKYCSIVVPLIAVIAGGCSKEEAISSSYQHTALTFIQLLTVHDYSQAYAMTSQGYRKLVTQDQLKTAFETIVPADFGPIGPIKVGKSLTFWPGKQAEDLGWVYISIGGTVYSEAITVVVTSEGGAQRIREIEFGRP